MKRIMLVVSYDGTAYTGWQFQPGQPTIEGELNKALSELTREDIHVVGASRTDAGVHAEGNVCIFDTDSRIPAEKFCYALNTHLPEDIVVQNSEEVPNWFHPRKCRCIKTYEYKIWNADHVRPFNRKYTNFVYHDLDVEKMQTGASYLVGEHDFTGYCSIHTTVQDHVRTILSADVIKEGDLITIRVTGNGFLYNMVRIIAGTLIQVGDGTKSPEDVKKALDACDRSFAGPTAPAMGLTLVRIDYPAKNRAECVKDDIKE